MFPTQSLRYISFNKKAFTQTVVFFKMHLSNLLPKFQKNNL